MDFEQGALLGVGVDGLEGCVDVGLGRFDVGRGRCGLVALGGAHQGRF